MFAHHTLPLQVACQLEEAFCSCSVLRFLLDCARVRLLLQLSIVCSAYAVNRAFTMVTGCVAPTATVVATFFLPLVTFLASPVHLLILVLFCHGTKCLSTSGGAHAVYVGRVLADGSLICQLSFVILFRFQ